MNTGLHKLAGACWDAWRRVGAYSGVPEGFWQSWVEGVAEAVGAELTLLYVRAKGGESDSSVWSILAHSPNSQTEKLPTLERSVTEALMDEARVLGVAYGACLLGPWRVGLIGLSVDDDRGEVLLVVHLGTGGEVELHVRHWLALFRVLPTLYEAHRAVRQGERDAVRLAQAVELIGRVLESDQFDLAILVVVHEFAERFACETVSLSWYLRGELRLCALSHSDRIDRRSELTALMEEVGQEALIQRVEIAWPAHGKLVTRAHQQYAELQRPGYLLTLPIFRNGHPLGAVTLERRRMAFSGAEQWALRLYCDMLPNPLHLLESRARALPKRLWAEIGRSVPARWKPVTVSGKRLSMGLLITFVLLMMLPLPYFVGATAIVKTDTMAFVGAPFDGYLESAPLTLGATVKQGDLLFTLATRELILERAGILADLAQYSREAEKRRSAGQMPEMQIAEAQAAQATARMQLIDYRLESAQARSPVDGVLVEGEPGKNLGSAVRRGDVVVKVAALSELYVEGALREQDATDVRPGQVVRLSLLANPATTYHLKLMRVIPSATVKEGENTFPVRMELGEVPPDWWRPGMSCVARISVGWRPVFWIITHRLVDYLRLALWL